MSTRKAVLRDVASYLPEATLTNEELAAVFPDWPAEKIFEKTGIRARHIAAPAQCASDLAVEAAKRLFAARPAARSEVNFVLLCTQSPDYFLPASSCLVQQRLGLPTSVGALDFNQGCSGFVYGLALAKGLVEGGMARGVLLLTAETYSKHLDAGDRATRTLFGDAGAAALIGGVESDRDLIGPFVFGSDGRGAGNLIVRGGAMRERCSPADPTAGAPPARPACALFMDGPEIFTFTLQAVPAAVRGVLEAWGRPQEDVGLFVFHQANRFMLEKLRDKLRIAPERFWIDLEETGNTVSSTIPLAIETARENGRLTAGLDAMLVGFGVGYSWAACMLREQ